MSSRTRSPWTRFVLVYWQVILAGAMISVGFASVFLAWWGVSGNPLVPVQLTYLAGWGLMGIGFLVLGGALLVVFHLGRQNAILVRLVERSPGASQATEARDEVRTVLLPEGATAYHRPGCVYADGKPARAYPPGSAELEDLEPCSVCDPSRA